MINDMLKLTVDIAFPLRKGQQNYEQEKINIFPIEGYSNDENMWEFLAQLDINVFNTTMGGIIDQKMN